MENILFIIEFIGALILFFCAASIIGRIMKLDDYRRDHQYDYQKKLKSTSTKRVDYYRDSRALKATTFELRMVNPSATYSRNDYIHLVFDITF